MRLGLSQILSSGNVQRKVIQVLIHPRFRAPAAYFDIGIAVAESEIKLSEGVRPVCLPFNPVDHNQDSVILAGWHLDESIKSTKLNLQDLKVSIQKIEYNWIF